MLYEEYEKYKNKYYKAQKKFDEILSEKEKLFIKTQPGSTDYSKDKTEGGKFENPFDIYIIEKQRQKIEERLKEARSVLEDRKKLLKLKEEELRASSNPYDKIYVYKFMERYKIYKICRLVGYGEAQVYRILKKIRKNIKNDRI